jgi:hypothetical protein
VAAWLGTYVWSEPVPGNPDSVHTLVLNRTEPAGYATGWLTIDNGVASPYDSDMIATIDGGSVVISTNDSDGTSGVVLYTLSGDPAAPATAVGRAGTTAPAVRFERTAGADDPTANASNPDAWFGTYVAVAEDPGSPIGEPDTVVYELELRLLAPNGDLRGELTVTATDDVGGQPEALPSYSYVASVYGQITAGQLHIRFDQPLSGDWQGDAAGWIMFTFTGDPRRPDLRGGDLEPLVDWNLVEFRRD